MATKEVPAAKKEGAKENEALDKVTDFVEEAEISEEKAKKAMDSLKSSKQSDIKVKDKDVKFLAKELDIDDVKATALLRQNGADLSKAIRSYIHS